MSFRLRVTRICFLILFFAALVIAGSYFNRELEKLRELHVRRKILFVPLLASQFVIWWSLSYSWQTSLRLMGRHFIKTGDAFVHVTLCNAAKYIPGSLWGYLARHQLLVAGGISHPSAVSAMTWDAVGSLTSGVLVGSMLCVKVISQSVPHLWLICATLLFFPLLIALPRVLLLTPARWRTALRIEAFCRENNGMHFFGLILTYCLTWVIVGASYCLVSAMILPELPTQYEALILAGSCCLGIVAGFLAFFAPGGIGIREALSTSMMATVIPLDQALAIAISFRVWTTFTDVLGGVLGLLWYRFVCR